MEIEGVVFLYSLLIGGLSMFVQECFQSNMIFRRYYLWLNYHYIRRHNRSLLKILGLCVYCQNFWLTVLLYPLFFKIDPWIILSVGGSYISVELIKFIKHGMD